MSKARCINIDWLEVYCVEDAIGFPHDAEYFRQRGWLVKVRDYGTRIYNEMFTLFTHDDMPFIEVRRSPKSTTAGGGIGILDAAACHVRLHNRTCYFNDAAGIMQKFLDENGFHFKRISRLDLALDFEVFDSGDYPAKFVRRFMNGAYSKINQADIRAFGKDMWDGRVWNSLSWGSPKSAVSTKFYNKSLELATVHDKPYIRQAWYECGLVADPVELWALDRKGAKYYPDIWRVEFSIKSGTRGWYIIHDKNAGKRGIRSIRHTLDMYHTRQQLLNMFFSLAEHYFHFKKVVEKPTKSLSGIALSAIRFENRDRTLQRKDRCPDKTLFRPGKLDVYYKLENIATNTEPDIFLKRLRNAVERFRESHVTPEVFKAANVILETIETEIRLNDIARPWSTETLTALRLLVARNVRLRSKTSDETVSRILDNITDYGDLFGEVDSG